ncbi:MAG: hypothetical protein D6771_01445 [Zetaproteobacteria bacterium]|nr:MAG: hypothetical protein D6771_01445 [Zetaproteobacteria bacterium]
MVKEVEMRRWIVGCVLGMLFGAASGWAAVGKIAYATGDAWVERAGERLEAAVGMAVERRDVLETGDFGRIKVVLNDGTKIYVGSRSRIEVARYAKRQSRLVAAMNMFWGRVRFFVHRTLGGVFEVHTTTAVLGVRGTSFLALTPVPPNLEEIRTQGLHRDFARFSETVRLPTRVVLDTGRLFVRTRAGVEAELTPGRAADITPEGKVEVKRADASLRAKPPEVIQPALKEEKKETPSGEKPAEKAGGKEKPAKEKQPAAGKQPKPAPGAGKPPAAGGAPSAPQGAKGGAPTLPGAGGAAPPPPPAGMQPGARKSKPQLEKPVTPLPPVVQPGAVTAPTLQPPAAQAPVQDAVQNINPSTRVTVVPQFVLP